LNTGAELAEQLNANSKPFFYRHYNSGYSTKEKPHKVTE